MTPTRFEIEYNATIKSDSSNGIYLGFLKGVYWLLDYQNPKPHVAEVVKCGWMNRQVEQERKNFKGECRIFIPDPKEKIGDEFLTAIVCNHTRDENIPLKSRNGIISADEQGFICTKCNQWIDCTEQTKSCEHWPELGELLNTKGFTCRYCGKWVNKQNV